MFTGLVEEVGTVDDVHEAHGVMRIRIECEDVIEGLAIGDSVCVSGCCLTVVEIDSDGFAVQLVAETISRTNLGAAAKGTAVNLERSLSATGRFGGHIVQGHVDSPGVLCDIRDQSGGRVHRYEVPAPLTRYVVEKGSIAIDGVSLTISAAGDDWFEVALIPHTLSSTTLGGAAVGDAANLEVDLLAKYVESILSSGASGASGISGAAECDDSSLGGSGVPHA